MEAGTPKKIGRYSVERLLGSGAMGFVFLGRDPELDRWVAIKTVRDLGLSEDRLQTFLERFRNEARAAARLHHPSIVQVYDVGEDPEAGPFLVFEYVAGSTLKQLLRSRGPLEPAAVVRLAEEVADALDTAHSHEIIHRDLKPDNLLVTPDGRTKLADFGVARVPNAALTREGQFLGTPCYSAPETLREGRYGVQSDLFSFAAVLYEAITGARAFPGDDAVAVAHKVIHEEPSPPREVARGEPVPGAVDALLMRGLSKAPEDRYGSATELALALREAYEAAGVRTEDAAPRPGTGRFATAGRTRAVDPARQARRRTGALAFAAVLVGGLALGIGLIFAMGNGATGGSHDGDASTAVAAGGADPKTPSSTRDAAPPARPDAGPVTDGAVVVLSTLEDAGAAAADAPDPESMTPHEREEAAKDAIGRVRRHLRAGDRAAARTALDEARRFDPGHSDIAELERALR
ncbi:MAG: serine/threonine-protein kinase [Myxococcota bacterium]